MEDKKQNRLKLKIKKPTFDSVNKRGENRLNKVKVSNEAIIGDNDDIIHITDDEDDTKQCSRLMTTGTLDNIKLLEHDRWRGLNFPVCDVWKLDDLPIYKPEEFSRIKKNDQNDVNFSYKAKLNLPRLRPDYLTSKQPDYDVAILYDNSYTVSDVTSPPSYPSSKAQSVARFSGLKRQLSEELDADSKKINLNTDLLRTSKSHSFSASKLKSDFTETKKDKSRFHSVYASTSTGTIAETCPSVEREIKSQLCPICAMEFSHSQNQLDIDGHIAVCLSVAGDNVVW